MAEIKEVRETKQEINFDEFYNDLMKNWDDDNYVIEKINSLNLDKCDFLPHQKKVLEGILLRKQKNDGVFACFQESNEIEENGYALQQLGECYYFGIGVEKNEKDTFKFFKMANEKGNFHALKGLIVCYRENLGVEKNIAEQYRLYKIYAEKTGDLQTLHSFAYIYMNGMSSMTDFGFVSFEKDINEAIRLYKIIFEKEHNNKRILYYDNYDSVKYKLTNYYVSLSFEERYEFYKSLAKNSPVLKIIKNKQHLRRFETLILQEKINEIYKDTKKKFEELEKYLPPSYDNDFSLYNEQLIKIEKNQGLDISFVVLQNKFDELERKINEKFENFERKMYFPYDVVSLPFNKLEIPEKKEQTFSVQLLEMQEKINDLERKIKEKLEELERKMYLPPFADPRLPNGGHIFQQALTSRNKFD